MSETKRNLKTLAEVENFQNQRSSFLGVAPPPFEILRSDTKWKPYLAVGRLLRRVVITTRAIVIHDCLPW